MVVNTSKRIEFGQFLRVLLAKHNIRQTDIADLVGTSRSFMSGVVSGIEILTEKQYNIIYELLAPTSTESDLMTFARKYMEARSNIDIFTPGDVMMSMPVLDRMILKKIKNLTDDQKEVLLDLLDKTNFGNLDKMGEWADKLLGCVREEPAAYDTTAQPAQPAGTKKTGTVPPPQIKKKI